MKGDDSHMQPASIPLTREGRRVLAAKLARLRDEIIPELLTLRENSGHDSQLDNDYQRAVSQLASLCDSLARASAVEATPDDPRVVELGELVTLCLDDGTLACYLLVHPFEAPIGGRRVSADAPLGRALLGRRVGDEIDVQAPRGAYCCRILSSERLRIGAAVSTQPLSSRPPDRPIAGRSEMFATDNLDQRRTRS